MPNKILQQRGLTVWGWVTGYVEDMVVILQLDGSAVSHLETGGKKTKNNDHTEADGSAPLG